MIPVSARNIQFVGHTDQNGRGDGVQVIVHKGHAFIGHMFSDGFTITDVSDPRQPRPVNFVAAPPNSRALHLQTHDELLLTVNAPSIWVLQGYSDPNDYFKASITETFTKREKTFTAGLRVFDIAKPAEPPVHLQLRKNVRAIRSVSRRSAADGPQQQRRSAY